MKLHAATTVDGYKIAHGPLYPAGTNKVDSNLTPRSDKIHRRTATRFYDGKLVWIGAQGATQEVVELWNDFFATPKEKVIGRFARRMAGYLGGEVKATQQLSELHDVGYLPLTIKSLPEGSKVPFGIPVLTVTNTLPQFYWLVNYLETVISALTWKIATNATIAAEYKAIFDYYGELTGVDEFSRSIQGHDFSMRGMSGPEDAARSGFGPLAIGFIGTDTLPAMDYAEDYYDTPFDYLTAISVPATEHAVATSNILTYERDIKSVVAGCEDQTQEIRLMAEANFMRDLITVKHPTGIVSYVADSYDYWGVLKEILPELKNDILARQPSAVAPAKVVIRPDSGDPVRMICGYQNLEEVEGLDVYSISDAVEGNDAEVISFEGKYYVPTADGYDWDGSVLTYKLKEVTEAEVKGSVQVLWELFGGTLNEKGYKILDTHIGLIYGDSITTSRAAEILNRLEKAGFASSNIVFGIGSYTYQCNTRDTFGFAVKATNIEVNGEPISIFKDPKTDSGKKSAKGLLCVIVNNEGEFELRDNVTRGMEDSSVNCLQPIFRDGIFVKRTSLPEIREVFKNQ